MMNQPLVSVIMPAYNAENYIEETIESVLHQTYTNWELVIVNDASTDATVEKIEQYLQQEPRIRLYHQIRNQGSSEALNKALCQAKGGFICWLSADDKYKPNMLSDSVAFLESHPDRDVVFCRHEFIDAQSQLIEVWEPDAEYRRIGEAGCFEPYRTLLFIGNAFNGCAVMGRIAAYKKAGFFDNVYRYANDYDYMLRLMAYSKAGYLDSVLVQSRRHGAQVSNEGKNDLDAIHVYDRMLRNGRLRKALFQKAGLEDSKEAILIGFQNRMRMYSVLGHQPEIEECTQATARFLTEWDQIREGKVILVTRQPLSYKGNVQVWNPDEHRDLIGDIKAANPTLLITVDLAGFERSTLTDQISYNLLDVRQIHLILHERLANEKFLQKPLSLAMFFYCVGEKNYEYLKQTYQTLPYLKQIPTWQEGESLEHIIKEVLDC